MVAFIKEINNIALGSKVKIAITNNHDDDAVIELNVGGKVISTLKSTLMKESDSKLAKLLQGKDLLTRDSSGRFFLDCDPDIFCHLLEFLRFGVYPSNDKVIQVYEYAKHFGISALVNSLENFKTVQKKKRSDEAKSKFDLEKYETLKKDVSGRLLDLVPFKDICIYIIENSVDTNTHCTHEQRENIGLRMHNGYSYPVAVKVYKPPIRTSLIVSDVNLMRALSQDLCQLGYGKPKFSIKRGQICANCVDNPFIQILCILYSKKYENEKFDMYSFQEFKIWETAL